MKLFLHVIENVTSEDVLSCADVVEDQVFAARYKEADPVILEEVRATPNIWVCEVPLSFLQTPYDERHPRSLAEILPLFGPAMVTISEPLIEALEDVYDTLVRSSDKLCGPGTILSFLEAHMGQDAFLIDWVG